MFKIAEPSFYLRKEFIEKYINKKPNFGFNGLGEIVFYRTYSRLICDDCLSREIDSTDEGNFCVECESKSIRNEFWYETVQRVVEGVYSIQKNHINSFKLGWDEERGQKSAEEMYDRIFTMKFLPPGRGLWAMGTSIIQKKGFGALNNCAFVSTENLQKELTKPFEFLMDMSMLGVGVGFDVKGAGTVEIHKPLEEQRIYTVADTREGWVESVKILLLSYFKKNQKTIEFNYSSIRPEGTLIRTFGGKASGSTPLKQLHERITTMFKDREGQLLTITDIVNVMNMIGCCVIAGNVRRTAEIVFGDYDNEEYLKLKDYQWDGKKYVGSNVERSAYGWTSNNSIFAKLGMNYERVAQQVSQNGEPGFLWLDNVQEYSRMNSKPDGKDRKAMGANPCVEQSLESYELCCLVETFPTLNVDLEDYKKTLKYTYLYAKTVTLGNTHWVETNRVLLRNKRIGCSMSGISQFIEKEGISVLKKWCEEGYKTLQKYDKIYSDWFAVPASIKMTSIKPSGTVSKLPGVTSGMHYPEANYFIRRIRVAKNSTLLPIIEQGGYHIEEDMTDSSSMVVDVPVAIEGIRTIEQVSAWEQMSLAAFLQKYWADNQVSCTVTFKEEEKKEIENMLNYFQYQLKGISLLPRIEMGSFPQMPEEKISKEEYDRLVSKIKPLDFSSKKGESSLGEKFCTNDSCSL